MLFTLAIQKLGLEPQECFAFEDIPEGVKSAKQAGLTVYGIYDKYSESFKEDIKMVADGYLIDFSEAPNFRLRK